MQKMQQEAAESAAGPDEHSVLLRLRDALEQCKRLLVASGMVRVDALDAPVMDVNQRLVETPVAREEREWNVLRAQLVQLAELQHQCEIGGVRTLAAAGKKYFSKKNRGTKKIASATHWQQQEYSTAQPIDELHRQLLL